MTNWEGRNLTLVNVLLCFEGGVHQLKETALLIQLHIRLKGKVLVINQVLDAGVHHLKKGLTILFH